MTDMDALRTRVLLDRPSLDQVLDTCPFCKEDSAVRPILRKYYGCCSKCGATGPTCETPDEAAEKWNHRP